LKKYLNSISNQEPAEFWVGQGVVDEVGVEVAAGLDGDHHAGLHDPGRTERTKAVAFRPFRVAFEVAADVVNVHAKEVAKTVRLEHPSGQVCSHHVIDAALQESAYTWF